MRKFMQGAVAATMILAGTVTIAPGAHADDLNRELQLRNESDAVIVAFYASNVGTDDWQENVLGKQGEVDPGYHVWINLDDDSGYCRFDFKTVFDDGTYVIRRNVNICATHFYTITS